MPRKILSAQFSHETNTFSRVRTDMDAFKRRVFVEDEQVPARHVGTSTELGAHISAAQRYGWELLQPYAAHATPSGLVAAPVLEYAVRRLTELAPQVDGVILALHGAMVAEGQDDAEGYLLEQVRAALGPTKPIVVTLDMHANVTQRMADNANTLIAYRTYPHVDQFDVAEEAAALLHRMLERGQLTQTHLFRMPMLDGCDHGRTHSEGGMPQILKLAQEIQRQNPVLDVISVTAGFPWSDIEEAGPALTVTSRLGADDPCAAVKPLLDLMWRTRAQRSVNVLPLPKLISVLKEQGASGKPVVVADFSDNPGHGAPGDGIALVRALHHAGVRNVAVGCICDPAAVSACKAAKVGSSVMLTFGAKAYPELYGPPLTVACIVRKLTDGRMTYLGPMRKGIQVSLGPTATIEFDGISVVLVTNNLQVQDLNFFYSNGIDPLAVDVLVVKSQQHFRAAFEPIASRVLLADSGGFVSPNLAALPYRKVRRPVWPLDDIDGEPSIRYKPVDSFPALPS